MAAAASPAAVAAKMPREREVAVSSMLGVFYGGFRAKLTESSGFPNVSEPG